MYVLFVLEMRFTVKYANNCLAIQTRRVIREAGCSYRFAWDVLHLLKQYVKIC